MDDPAATTIARTAPTLEHSPASQNGANSRANVNAPTNDTPTSPIENHVGPGNSSVAAPAATSHASSLAEETTLLRAAHDAIAAGDPARALRLLDEHAARFPNSALEPERSAERVFAYCAAQDTAYARAAASSFLAAHPTGPLAMRVRSSCGSH
jgi:TolA-binding protein